MSYKIILWKKFDSFIELTYIITFHFELSIFLGYMSSIKLFIFKSIFYNFYFYNGHYHLRRIRHRYWICMLLILLLLVLLHSQNIVNHEVVGLCLWTYRMWICIVTHHLRIHWESCLVHLLHLTSPSHIDVRCASRVDELVVRLMVAKGTVVFYYKRVNINNGFKVILTVLSTSRFRFAVLIHFIQITIRNMKYIKFKF